MWNGRHDTKFRHDIMKSGFLLSIVYTVAIAGTFQHCCFGILISKPNKLVSSPRRTSYHTLVCHWSSSDTSPQRRNSYTGSRDGDSWGLLVNQSCHQWALDSVREPTSKNKQNKTKPREIVVEEDLDVELWSVHAWTYTYIHAHTRTHTPAHVLHTCTHAHKHIEYSISIHP